MRLSYIEAWCLGVAERALAGRPVEDARVELKASWPPAEKAARRIAGHANAARGEPILWVIGVDEKSRRLTGAGGVEPADWFAQVVGQFDGVVPGLTHLAVPYGIDTLVALYFETDRAPFVVRNAAYGSSAGGAVEREVPWREGTSVRSARRDELLRLLVPTQRLPILQPFNVWFTIEDSPQSRQNLSAGSVDWRVGVELYVVPRSQERVVVPLRQLGCRVTVGSRQFDWGNTLSVDASRSVSTLRKTQGELLIDGPGELLVHALTTLPPEANTIAIPPDAPAQFEIAMRPALAESAARATVPQSEWLPAQPTSRRWSYEEPTRFPGE